MPKLMSEEPALNHNLRRLKSLDPAKVAREWCEIDRKEAGENWKPTQPAEWFWEKKGFVIKYEVPPEVGESGLGMGLGPLYETFATEEGWRFETEMKAELEKVREEQQENKQQREVFDAAISGLLDRAKERKIIMVTKDDVKLYLFETGSQLGQGNIGMLTLAVNTKLGAKEIERERSELREQILRSQMRELR